MLYPNTCYAIDYTINFITRHKIVRDAVRHMLKTGEEIRFSKDASMWTENKNRTLVLCLYGYRPAKVNIDGMTFEDIVDEIIEAFHF